MPSHLLTPLLPSSQISHHSLQPQQSLAHSSVPSLAAVAAAAAHAAVYRHTCCQHWSWVVTLCSLG